VEILPGVGVAGAVVGTSTENSHKQSSSVANRSGFWT